MYVSAGYLPICKPFCAIDLLASKAVALASYARVASIRDNAYIVTSETCALDTIGAEFVRDIEPGEVITITPEKGIESDMTMALAPEKQARCVFEYIYFARPDSHVPRKAAIV